jgi:tRNA pseudouridine55 synthase
VVAVVRRQLGLRAVGHAGTLDPFATGLLVVLVGRATRLARFAEAARKQYAAEVRFGVATDTDDSTGSVIADREPTRWPTVGEMEAVLSRFVGRHPQRPPAYSAKHVAGRRSHQLAREGRPVELPAVMVDVHAITNTAWTPPVLRLQATVGKGTYLRALARDIGEAIGVPAHCSALRREAVGSFKVTEAIAPDEVRPGAVRSALAMVPDLMRVPLDAAARRDVGFGRSIAREDGSEQSVALVGSDGALVAVAEARGERWQPVVVLEPAA